MPAQEPVQSAGQRYRSAPVCLSLSTSLQGCNPLFQSDFSTPAEGCIEIWASSKILPKRQKFATTY